MTAIRIALVVLGVAGGVLWTPWMPAIAILALSFLFRAWEAPLVGLLMDFIWSPLGALPLFALGAIAAVWLLEPVRREFLTG